MEQGDLRVTFINHSTTLLQFDGVNILTDPVWSTRVSPFSFAGPRRHPTVHVGTSTSYVLSLVRDSNQELDERHRAEAERLIRRDHDFNERRRR